MIKATFYRQNDIISGFKVLNHGDEIVCAGVSALVITCVNFIQAKLGVNAFVEHDPKGGLIHLKLSETTGDAQIILEHLTYGLELIKETYPKEIKISFREEV
ncbi:MAG: ribosomal-processing cysteine protease Prp [Defluviitaleaceae bacterium]|nr:ribosomal-processing cysteine protease Prp [Defluviitaleaceae bacterium]